MILLIDNYDSFTHNLVHLIGGLGETVIVKRNDAISASEALSSGAEAIVISPGPKTPDHAGVCLELIAGAAEAKMPVFGVCLGMQAIAQCFGARVERAEKLMHGKTCNIVHDGAGMFSSLPSPFMATRYHSLIVERKSLTGALIETAKAEDDDEVMAISHTTLPMMGVQFHPESIASEQGAALLRNFLTSVRT
ncbi:MAG: aminodeoxychorismate/anthranilate synthase component II [Hyphococcus sp.]|nr:MAG: aminodeoxychorismate/anthranilate synthase component II [Marinicaulis sp.]